jgi:hypothetical protein
LKLEDAVEWEWIWKNKGTDNLKASIPVTDYDRSETAGECGIFQLFG